jgi:hypothetical protein
MLRRNLLNLLLLALIATTSTACKKEASPAQTSVANTAPATAPAPSVDVIIFDDKGAQTRQTVLLSNPKAAEPKLRAALASAFAQPAPTPHVVGWLVAYSRPMDLPPVVKTDKGEVRLAGSYSSYSEYRVLPPAPGKHGVPFIQNRRGKNDEWMDYAGALDPQIGLDRAMMYLSEDLHHVQEMSEYVFKWPTSGPTTNPASR